MRHSPQSVRPSWMSSEFTLRRCGPCLGLLCSALLCLLDVDVASAKGHDVERLMRAMELGPPAPKRLRIIAKLGQSKDPRVVPMLRLALRDESSGVRRRARRALRALSVGMGASLAAPPIVVQPDRVTDVSLIAAQPGSPMAGERPSPRARSKRVHITVGFGRDASAGQYSHMAFVHDALVHTLRTLPGTTVSEQSPMLTRELRDPYERQYRIDGAVQVLSRSWEGGQSVACKMHIVVSSLPAQRMQMIATEEGTVKSGSQPVGEAALERACLQASVGAFRKNLAAFLETHRRSTQPAMVEIPPKPIEPAPVAARPRDPDAAMEISFDESS